MKMQLDVEPANLLLLYGAQLELEYICSVTGVYMQCRLNLSSKHASEFWSSQQTANYSKFDFLSSDF